MILVKFINWVVSVPDQKVYASTPLTVDYDFVILFEGIPTTWRVECTFNKDHEDASEDSNFISFFLHLIDGKIDQKITADFSILSIDSAEKLTSASFTPRFFTAEDAARGFTQFITLGELKAFKNAISPDQSINIRVAVKCVPASDDDDCDDNPITQDVIVAALVKRPANVQLKTSDGEILYVNDEVVAGKSNIIQTYREDMQFKTEDGELEQIAVDCTHPVMIALISFMYYGSVDAIGVSNNFSSIIKAAEKFEVVGMIELCTRMIYKCLNDNNALETAALAVERNDNDLFEKCCKHIGVISNQLMAQNDWVGLDNGVKLKMFTRLAGNVETMVETVKSPACKRSAAKTACGSSNKKKRKIKTA